ncbi:gremlin-2-like, partial [Tropilaelaps mercedesae]
ILEFLRQRKSRRASRRRCSGGVCRRGSTRLLRTLSAKLPKDSGLSNESEREREITLLDLLKTSKSPAQVLMGMDKIRENFCKTQPFAQTIQLPGCHPKSVINNFCYGQCNSFFIPNHSMGPFRTCGNCEATKTHTMKIQLACPGHVDGVQTVHVEKVLNCACISRPADTSGEA